MSRRRVEARAKQLRVKVTVDHNDTWALDAPCGSIFAGALVHYFTWEHRPYRDGPGHLANEIYADMLAEMKAGLEPCGQPQCEICEELAQGEEPVS